MQGLSGGNQFSLVTRQFQTLPKNKVTENKTKKSKLQK
jgi:hypothetical protein